MKTRLQLKSNYNKISDINDDINFLDDAFRKKFKKAPAAGLFVSSSGPVKKSKLELVVAYENDEIEEVNFFIAALNQKPKVNN